MFDYTVCNTILACEGVLRACWNDRLQLRIFSRSKNQRAENKPALLLCAQPFILNPVLLDVRHYSVVIVRMFRRVACYAIRDECRLCISEFDMIQIHARTPSCFTLARNPVRLLICDICRIFPFCLNQVLILALRWFYS